MPWYLPISEAIDHGIYAPVQTPLTEGKGLHLEVTYPAREPAAPPMGAGGGGGAAAAASSAGGGGGGGGTGSSRRIHFQGSGPTHMTLVINATSAPLVKWPWTDTVPLPRPDCDCYFVYYAAGRQGSVWDFELEVNGTQPLALTFYGHYVDQTSPEIERVLGKLPDWVAPVAWVSYWKDWRG